VELSKSVASWIYEDGDVATDRLAADVHSLVQSLERGRRAKAD